jgi:hypothetical protein
LVNLFGQIGPGHLAHSRRITKKSITALPGAPADSAKSRIVGHSKRGDCRGCKLEPDPHGCSVGSSGKRRSRLRRFLAITALPTNHPAWWDANVALWESTVALRHALRSGKIGFGNLVLTPMPTSPACRGFMREYH